MKKLFSLFVPLLALMLSLPVPQEAQASASANVNVFQTATVDTTKILYDLPANAVDLGTGVAWATSNYDGAEESKFAPDNTVAGPYYKPSEIILPQNWRIPTQEDGSKLIGNSFTKNGSVVTIKSLIDNQTVTLVGSGYGRLNSYNTNRYTRPGSGNYGDSYPEYPYYYLGNSGNTYYLLNINTEVTPNTLGVLALVNIYNATYYFTTRLVYDPSFTTHTLTIHCGDKTYTYMCEDGQSVTVTAKPNTAEAQAFKWWSDDHSNTTAERTFTVNSDIEVEAVFTLDPNIPQGTATFVDWNGTQLYEVAVPVGYTPVYKGQTPTRIGYNFSGWSPAIEVMGGSDVTYTATYTFDSPDANVNVYQNVTNSTTKILYNISAKTGLDGLTYTPIDMGYGVAWADKNIGAATENAVGSYFYWGGTEAKTSFAQNQKLNASSYAANYRLSVEQDAAYQNMGTNWRVPTNEDFQNLINNTTVSDNNTLTSQSNSESIVFPASGLYAFDMNLSQYQHYWTNTLASNEGNGNATIYIFIRSGNNTYKVQNKIAYYSNEYAYNSYGMPIRAIYQPEYNTHTLTITVSGQQYRYICQEGQSVTVTAVPDASNAQMFKWWSDDNSNTTATRTFTMTNDDISVEAVFQIDPSIPTHTATFVNWNGSQLYQVIVPKGVTPVYGGVTPTKTYWNFDGWTPAISAMGDDDVTYTATFSFESVAASVDVYQNVSANTTKILYDLSEKTGVDGNTYIPIDLGYGVAWADRNVGATSTESVGGYFRWGVKTVDSPNNITTATTLGSRSGTYTLVSSADDATNEDAATANMGPTWRMPTTTEYQNLINNTDKSNNKRFSNKSDNSLYIELPPSGYYINSPNSKSNTDYQYYWTSQKPSNQNRCYALERTGNNTYESNTTYDRPSNNQYARNNSQCHMPIRAIYVPSYTTYTLTINVGSYSYQYICQAGQSITVTANATTSGNVFDKWLLANGSTPDNVDGTLATRTFVMTDNITRTATFKEAPLVTTYDVTIESSNTSYGTVDVTAIDDVESGTEIIVSGTTLTIGETTVTPIKTTDDAQYTYAFAGWTDDEGEDLPKSVTDDLTIRANFTQTLNTYTVTWKDEDGETILETDASVAYGDTPSFDGETPTKDADEEAAGYTYTFDAWTPAITTVTGDATYTASYTPHKKQYSLVWDVNGGNALTGEYTHGDNIEWGTPITAPADPTKDDFDFAGWDATPAATMPAATTTYTAQWTAQSDEFELVDDKYEGDAWYTTLANLAGKKKNVTYKRTMAANQWNVVSLPFDFNLWENQNHTFHDCIYAFEGAEYDNGSLNFNFVSVSTTMTANTPYVFYSGTKAENVRFEGVEIKAQKADNTTYVTDGKVQFRNTIVRENLSPDGPDKRKVYIYDNRLYYPNNYATWMRAFRGYFYLDMTEEEIKHVQPRMRIISGGQVTTELELVPDKADDGVRKYIENGIMVIERNGVRYNAQGAKID